MIVYLASPQTQQQMEHCAGMPVLLSFAVAVKCSHLHKGYQQSFSRVLIDSGAFTEFTTGKKVDIDAYADWSRAWLNRADAVAGLDDMGGDWRTSLRNYEAFPEGFPTFHFTDPPQLLPDLVAMAVARKQWLGVGMCGQQHIDRAGKERWLRDALGRVPEGVHVHGWALRQYTHVARLGSVDSTNWWRDAMRLRTMADLAHLTYGECLEIIIKRYQRWGREIRHSRASDPSLFDD